MQLCSKALRKCHAEEMISAFLRELGIVPQLASKHKMPFCRKATAVCPCFPGPQDRGGTAAKEEVPQTCKVVEKQKLSNGEDASALRALSSFYLCLLLGVRVKGAGDNLEEGLVSAWQKCGDSQVLGSWLR